MTSLSSVKWEMYSFFSNMKKRVPMMRFSPMTIQINKAKKVLGGMIKVSCSRMKQQSKSWHIF